MVEVEIPSAWEASGCVGNFFVSAHLVIILEWKSAHAGRNSGRKLKQMHKDHEIT